MLISVLLAREGSTGPGRVQKTRLPMKHRRTSALLLAASLTFGACAKESVSTELLSPPELEQACVISAACGIQVRARVSNCVDYYYDVLVDVGLGPVYTSLYRCVLQAGSECNKVAACFGQTGSCGKDSFQAYCDGATAYTCDLLDERVYGLQCGVAGLRCAPNAGEPFAASCICEAGFAPRCHGNYAVACQGGQIDATDCLALGGSCVDGACRVPSDAPSCQSSSFVPRCEGSVAVFCASGQQQRSDCGQRPIERRCQAGACVRTGSECTDEFNRCTSSGDLEACIDGQWKIFGCAQLGLGDCRTAFYGANCARFN